MAKGNRTVAVVTPDGTPPPDVAGPLTRGGFAVRGCPLTTSTMQSDVALVLIVVDDQPNIAAAFTRRCRAGATSPKPVVWLIAIEGVHSAPTGFDSGADVCLVRPVEPDILLAQVNVLLRSYSELSLRTMNGADTVAASERLGRLLQRSEREAELARQTLLAFAPVPPLSNQEVNADWVHVPSTRRGVNTLGVVATTTGLRFALTTVNGLATPTGAAFAEALMRFILTTNAPPAVALSETNRHLRELDLPDTAILSVTVGNVTAEGKVVVSCGGHPPPVFVPADGPARLWHGVGPFLGQSEAGYSEIAGELNPNDCLLLLSGGAAADKRPDVRAAADERPTGALGEFVRSIAENVFTPPDADDGYTLLGVSRTNS